MAPESSERGGTCGGETFVGSCRVYVNYILLSSFFFLLAMRRGRVLALAASAIGLGIAMAGTFGVRCRAWLNALYQKGSYSRRLSHPRDRRSGAGIVIPESVSLGSRLIPNKRGRSGLLHRLFSWYLVLVCTLRVLGRGDMKRSGT
jgi:hypothetical protein